MGRKRRIKRVKSIPQTQILAAEKAELTAFQTRMFSYQRWVALACLFFGLYFIYDHLFGNHLVSKTLFHQYSRWLKWVAIVLLIVVGGYSNQLSKQRPTPQLLHRYRRARKSFIAIGAFIPLQGLVSVLSARGYLEILQTQLATVSSFLVLAIISGVVGNVAYDLLKHWFLKKKE